MTRQDRVNRYIEILDKSERGNCVRNWDILDKLTDEELFSESKIAECIAIIDKCDERLKNNSNKYPEDIMECVRQRLGLDKYDDSRDSDINNMSANEVFEHVCNWNGLLGHATFIKSWIHDIYKIDLDANKNNI